MAKQQPVLHSVADVVKAFGGNKPIAKWCNVRTSAVSNWLERDYIPPGWHYRMAVELGQRGYQVDPMVFGINAELVGNPYRAKRVA
jgi:hypothetical protein